MKDERTLSAFSLPNSSLLFSAARSTLTFDGGVLLCLSLCRSVVLGGSVVIFAEDDFTTEAQSSTESHRDSEIGSQPNSSRALHSSSLRPTLTLFSSANTPESTP